MNIERTLFWFKDGDEMLLTLNERFFALGNLLNRLLNENYDGKKIKFINIDLSTQKTYDLHPALPKDSAYYYGGHLKYYGLIDFTEFNELSEEDQNYFIWTKTYEYLQVSAKTIKNSSLLAASEYAYNHGLEIKLNADYKMAQSNVIIYGEDMLASVWVHFMKGGTYSKFTLEKNGQIVFEKNIDRTKNGVEFFLEMYKSISAEGNTIVIKGRKDVEYLPLSIVIER